MKMSARTLDTARQIVAGLRGWLSSCSSEDLPGVRSVCVYGTLVRGDWLERNSDLDVAVLRQPDAAGALPAGHARLGEVASDLLGGRAFPSHTPGGVDFCTLPSFPTTDDDVRRVSGFFPFNIFLFDFLQHSEMLWGEDFRRRMPAPPDPVSLAAQALERLLDRVHDLGRSPALRHKAPFNAYKATVIAQLFFGERTLDKTRMLALFHRNVPDFPTKAAAESLIRQYVGATYPDHPPEFEAAAHYVELIRELQRVVRDMT
jgi:predicted nucleotidyltransferase